MTEQRLITLALFAYNQERYIREAVKGALNQTYSPLEIILSDDGSSDRTFDIMEELVATYHGPHTVVLNRNQRNLGLVSHVNRIIMEFSHGDIIVMAAGDDISFPRRVDKIWEAFSKDDTIYSVSMNYKMINQEGVPLDKQTNYRDNIHSIDEYVKGAFVPLCGCTRAYRKSVYEVFGPLSDVCSVEDAPLIFRSILLGRVCHVDEIGILYRACSNSLSTRWNLSRVRAVFRQLSIDTDFALSKQIIDPIQAKRIRYLQRQDFVRRSKMVIVKMRVFSHFYRLYIKAHKIFSGASE